MKAAQGSNDTEAMLAAARLNWQLWTIIQSELLSPECSVPLDIRQNVLSLANFIDKHTVGFIGMPKPAKLDVLISINRELAGGLHAQVAAEPAVADEAPAADPAAAITSTDTSA